MDHLTSSSQGPIIQLKERGYLTLTLQRPLLSVFAHIRILKQKQKQTNYGRMQLSTTPKTKNSRRAALPTSKPIRGATRRQRWSSAFATFPGKPSARACASHPTKNVNHEPKTMVSSAPVSWGASDLFRKQYGFVSKESTDCGFPCSRKKEEEKVSGTQSGGPLIFLSLLKVHTKTHPLPAQPSAQVTGLQAGIVRERHLERKGCPSPY